MATIVCKNLARVCLRKLAIEREVFAILFHDYLAFYDLLSPNPSIKALEVFDWGKTRPFLALPMCSISSVQHPKHDETTVVMTVWETELSIKFPSHALALVWHYELDFRVSVNNPFGSFATPKQCPDKSLELYHCGQEYFSALADALEAATTCIMITGWWFSPQIYLKRDTFPMPQQYRLDNLLQAKAQTGVKVYIMLFKENELAINLGSRLAKIYMESLDRNISVLLHGPPTWAKVWYSHHQKTVVIDQHIAFVGGIDLCFGRYDTTHHPLTDTPPSTFIGADYYNQCQITVTVAAMAKPFLDIMDKDRPMRETMPREPWNDVQAKVIGGAARDIATNFVQRWISHHVATGTSYDPSMSICPIPIAIPHIRHEEKRAGLVEVEDEVNTLRFGDQIRLWAWSPACPPGVAGGYVGIDKKHQLCGLGPGSIDRFAPSSFRVMSAEISVCTKAGCLELTDHPEVRVCPKHAGACYALSCSNARLRDPESDYCEEHHFSAAERSQPPPVRYGDKLALVSENQTVWNNDVKTWFQGYIKLDKRGIEGEMNITFQHNPNLPAKASKPINVYDSGVSIRVMSSHRPASVDLDNMITLYPKHKTQGFLGCSGGSPITFTLHHAAPSEAQQKELDDLNTRIQQLQIKTRVLKEAVTKYEEGPARDNIAKTLEEAEKSLKACIEERRCPSWRLSSVNLEGLGSQETSSARSIPTPTKNQLDRSCRYSNSGSRRSGSCNSCGGDSSSNRSSWNGSSSSSSSSSSGSSGSSGSGSSNSSSSSSSSNGSSSSSGSGSGSSSNSRRSSWSGCSDSGSCASDCGTSPSPVSLGTLHSASYQDLESAHPGHVKHNLRSYLSAPVDNVRVHMPSPKKLQTSAQPEVSRTCQVLRSLTNTWSGGTFRECSILTGYLHAIANAKRFLYIEQQFFVSSLDDPTHPVRNLVAKALFDRISQAILDHESFFVVIMLPIAPEGNFNDRSVRLIMHYQRCSIDHGKFSLMKQLEARFKDIDIRNYINFCALRTHDPATLDAKGRPRTMQIYVHSKLLIADDRVMILGSANINDRSLSGNRDSEICIRVEEPLGCGLNSIQKFRRRLWANYLAVDDVDIIPETPQVDLMQTEEDEAQLDGSPGRVNRLCASIHKAEAKVQERFHKVEAKFQEGLQKAEAKFQEGLQRAEAIFDKGYKKLASLERMSLGDGASSEVKGIWKRRADANTKAYQECYPYLPHSSIKSYAQLNALSFQTGDPGALQDVRGFVVRYPGSFLEDENLMPDFLDKENLVPAECFT